MFSFQILLNQTFNNILNVLQTQKQYIIKQIAELQHQYSGYIIIQLLENNQQYLIIQFDFDLHNQIPLYYNTNTKAFQTQYDKNLVRINGRKSLIKFDLQGNILNIKTQEPNFQYFQPQIYINQSLEILLINLLTQYFETLFQNKLQLQLNLSGGVDSTLLFYICKNVAQKYNTKFDVVNTCFVKQSPDSSAFQQIQKSVPENQLRHINFKQIIITEKRFQTCLQEVKELLKPIDTTIMNINLTSVTYYSITDKKLILINGLGPDEYFGAYKRFNNKQISQEQRQIMQDQAVSKLNERNLIRDSYTAQKQNIKVLYPYLQENIVGLFNYIRYNCYEQYGLNKQVIRLALKNLGCPQNIYEREKQAAQFGSGCAKILQGKSGYDII